MSHLGLMVLYATLVSVFCSAYWRRERRDQVILFLQLFGGMVVGGLVLAWIMYFVHPAPPTLLP